MSMKRKKFEKKKSKKGSKFENNLNNWYSQLIKCYTEEFSCVPKSPRK